MDNQEKIEKLEEEIKKYRVKLKQLETDWAVGKGGSRYGDEYLETQVKVHQAMIMDIKKEILKLKEVKNKK